VFRTGLVSLVVLLAVGTGAWANGAKEKGSAGSTQASASKPYTVAMVPKLIGVPYFNRVEEGAKKAAAALGVNLIFTGPTTVDPAAQVSAIEDLISKGVNAIAVAPNDPAAVTPVLMKARQAGILVMDFDTPADPSVVDYSIHQIDDQQYGEHIWDLLVKYMGDSGQYAIITGGLSASNLNSWIKYGETYAKTKYPGLKLVTDPIGTDEKQQVAFQKTLDLMKAYPNLKGIIGISTPASPGAAQAIEQLGLQGKVANVGTSLPSMVEPFLKDKSVDAATLWDPAKLGYLTVALAKQVLSGQKPTNGEMIDGVGTITLKPDGKTVIMGPPQDFTESNVAQFPF